MIPCNVLIGGRVDRENSHTKGHQAHQGWGANRWCFPVCSYGQDLRRVPRKNRDRPVGSLGELGVLGVRFPAPQTPDSAPSIFGWRSGVAQEHGPSSASICLGICGFISSAPRSWVDPQMTGRLTQMKASRSPQRDLGWLGVHSHGASPNIHGSQWLLLDPLLDPSHQEERHFQVHALDPDLPKAESEHLFGLKRRVSVTVGKCQMWHRGV